MSKYSLETRDKIRLKKTKWTEVDVFRIDSGLADATTKTFFLKLMIREGRYSCAECGLTRWRGKFIVLQIDHINGNRRDNRRENLRLLCALCHSQTDNFGGANAARCKVRGRQLQQLESYYEAFSPKELT